MSMFIASANTNTMNNPIKVITAKDVAERLGLSVRTVNNCFMKKPIGAAATIAKVLEAAKEMGYDSRKARGNREPRMGNPKPEKFWYNGNFHSHKEEVERMKALRTEGFSNAEIAKKIGRTIQHVRRHIGAQPLDMTKANVIQGAKNRAAKNARRKAYVQSHKVVEHNELVRQVNEVGDKLRASMAEMNTLRQTHEDLVAKVANAEADIRKVAEKMGMTVVEVKPVEIPKVEAKAETPVSLLN